MSHLVSRRSRRDECIPKNPLVRVEISESPLLTVYALRATVFFSLFSLSPFHKSTLRFSKTLTSVGSQLFSRVLLTIQSTQNLASRYQPPRMSPDAIVALAVLGLFLVTLIILAPAVCVLVFYGKLSPWIIPLVVGADILITVASLGLFTPGASFTTSL